MVDQINFSDKEQVRKLREALCTINPEWAKYTDTELISAYDAGLNDIQLTEEQKVSVLAAVKSQDDNMGLVVERTGSPEAVPVEQAAPAPKEEGFWDKAKNFVCGLFGGKSGGTETKAEAVENTSTDAPKEEGFWDKAKNFVGGLFGGKSSGSGATNKNNRLSWNEIGNIALNSGKNFVKGLFCDENGDFSWKKTATTVGVVAGLALAPAAVAALGAGPTIVGLVSGGIKLAGIGLTGYMVYNGGKNVIQGTKEYYSAESKEDAVEAMEQAWDGGAELASIPVLGGIMKFGGKLLGKVTPGRRVSSARQSRKAVKDVKNEANAELQRARNAVNREISGEKLTMENAEYGVRDAKLEYKITKRELKQERATAKATKKKIEKDLNHDKKAEKAAKKELKNAEKEYNAQQKAKNKAEAARESAVKERVKANKDLKKVSESTVEEKAIAELRKTRALKDLTIMKGGEAQTKLAGFRGRVNKVKQDYQIKHTPLKRNLETTKAEIKKTESLKRQAEADLADARRAYEKSLEINSQLKPGKGEMQRRVNNASTKLKKAEDNLAEIEASLKDLKSKKVQYENDIKALNGKTQKELAVVEEEIAAQKKLVAEYNQEIKRLEKLAAQQQRKVTKAAVAQNKKFNKASKKAQEASEKYNKNKKAVEKYERTLPDAESRYLEAKNKYDYYTDKVANEELALQEANNTLKVNKLKQKQAKNARNEAKHAGKIAIANSQQKIEELKEIRDL